MAAESPPSDNLFVADLPAGFSEDMLKQILGAYGTITQTKMVQGAQGKGAALVRFGTQGEATWIKENLNGNIPQGLTTPIVVRYANAPGKGKGDGKGDGKGGCGWTPFGGGGKGKDMGPEAPPSDNLFVADLPTGFTEDMVKQILGAYGTITHTKIVQGAQGKGAALVRFATQGEATWIKENVNGNIPQGLTTPIVVRYANAPGPGSKGAGEKGDGKGGGDNRWSPYGGGKGDMSWKGGGGWGGDDWGMPKGKGKGKGKEGIKGVKQSIQASLPGGKWNNDENALFVGGLPPDTTTEDMYELFTPFGPMPAGGCKAMVDEWGMCKGIGFVNYLHQASSQTAIMTLNGTAMADGTTLKVSVKQTSKSSEGGKGGK